MTPYIRYLKRTFEKASAAWRREQNKRPQVCQVCEDPKAEVTPEGFWLCRAHKAELKAMQPYKSYTKRIEDMNIPYLSEEDFLKGLEPPKKKRKMKIKVIEGVQEYSYSAGKTARKPATRRKTK